MPELETVNEPAERSNVVPAVWARFRVLTERLPDKVIAPPAVHLTFVVPTQTASSAFKA